MADTDQKRVRSIFLAAVEDLAPEQWDDFLGHACRGEPELRQRVEFLLHGHQQPNELLDDPGAAPVAPSQPSIGEVPGTFVGSYKLLEQIGEGGFGVVFMAEQQQPVHRKVALKIVKPGMDTRQVVARFEAERQALALMDHPNIAQIYDGGATESGRPYFVMELVRGIPITDFCNQYHLGIRERLELFIHVCQAVQHAHQKGIIHRDLKPANVMVTQNDIAPIVKIIDFGIAKATGQRLTEKTLFTNYAQMIGTPMYMSPEQAQMRVQDVDTRSDVYSLGVLLYELMTGKTPFDKERLRTVAYDEMMRIIREEEPVRPSTRLSTLGNAPNSAPIDRNSTLQKLSQMLRGELDWIVMKALEKDRNRRYESASALGNEVQRYLRDEPVQACPPSLGYRLQKTLRRHKAALAMATIVFAALSAGTAVATWQAVVATRAAAAEKTAKLAVEAKEAEARAVISFLENRVLSAARPEGHEGGLGHDVLLRRAIESAVPFVQEGFKDQPLIEARLRMTLGTSFEYLGEPKKSRDQRVAARAIYTKLLGAEHETTLRSAMALVTSYYADSQFAEACQLCEKTLAQMRLTLGPEHVMTLRCMDHLAVCYAGLGRSDDALKVRQKALDFRKAQLGPEHPRTIQCLLDLGCSYTDLGRHREALAVEEEVVALRKAKLGADHIDTLESMNNLACTYEHLARYQDACKTHAEVLALRKIKLGVDHPATLMSMCNLACCYGLVGQDSQALKLFDACLPLAKAKLGLDHALTLRNMSNMANICRSAGREAEAVELCEEALRRQKAKWGLDHPDVLFSMHTLALCYSSIGRHEDALELGKETLTRRKAALGVDHNNTLWSMSCLGMYYSNLGRHDEALAAHEETLAMRTKKLGAAHPDTLVSLECVARILIRLDRGAEAVPIIDEGIKRALSVGNNTRFIGDMMILRMQYFIKLRDVAGCRSNAVLWEKIGRTDGISLYNTACAHAVVAWMIREQDSSAEAEKQSNTEADHAMNWLHRAIAGGFRDAEHIANDADLDVLRKRPDFIKLMADMKANPPKSEE